MLIDDLQLDTKKPSDPHLHKYDVVVCYHVIEHIKFPGLFMENICKLLKPGGVLIIGTPNMNSFAARLFKGNFRLFDEAHVSLFNSHNLEWLLKQNNLTIFRKEYPFFKTEYFTLKNLFRLFQTNKPSPPFYGNIMTMYAENKVGKK
jgi:2-polyprenyl-3-methyl-5-hydroxy-6-metoxy-1,4-benzoquinol methylase